MEKNIRLKIYNKYNGHCAYCGHEITLTEMQVDHITPKRDGGKDEMDNYNPSCRICNHYKRATSLEIWRNYFLKNIINRLRQVYIFKVAERFGMITINDWDSKFYFEEK